MKRLFYLLLFVLSFLFYWGTGRGIENRTEAEDVFEYAMMVEQGSGHPWFYHEHHLLYGPVMRGAYEMARWVGYDGRAIDVMRFISALASAGTLFFFFLFCYKRYSLRPVSSVLATMFLGLSYGFWRYAAESEIPLVASFLIMVALYYSTDEERRKRALVWTLFFSVLAVWVHIMNAVAVFFAIPLFYLLRKRVWAAVLQVGVAAIVIWMGYALIDCFADIHGGGGASFGMVDLGDGVKGLVALVQCVISSDFMMGFRSVRAFLAELFAGRMLLEEFHYGVRLSRAHILFSALTYLLFFGLLMACLGRALWLWVSIAAHRLDMRVPKGARAQCLPVFFFLGYGGLLLCIEPGNPELWIMGLIPFALSFCGMVLLPLTMDNRLWLPFLMLLVLLVHNAEALRMLRDPDKDYQFQKSRTVLALAGEDDVILTAGNPVFERYLRYHFKGKVVYLYDFSIEELSALEAPQRKGEWYVLNDVFEQPKSLRVRFPGQTQAIDAFAERIRPHAERVADDDFGGVYTLDVMD